MARHVTFDCGSFNISSYLDKNFVLAVSTRMSLAVPASLINISTVADLRDQVQSGSLWIAQAGSCHIELDIGFGESFGDATRDALKHMCIEAFEDFPVSQSLLLSAQDPGVLLTQARYGLHLASKYEENTISSVRFEALEFFILILYDISSRTLASSPLIRYHAPTSPP